MVERGYTSKYGPDNDGPRALYIDHQIGGCDPRMNLYTTTDVPAAADESAFAQRVVGHWSEDPDANANLVASDLTHEGFGIAVGQIDGERRLVIVQTFCD
jgi:uncharacterized protein YkwD